MTIAGMTPTYSRAHVVGTSEALARLVPDRTNETTQKEHIS
jgi:hypothetical protein